MRETYEVKLLGGYPPEIAVWLWAMAETRQKTKTYVQGISQDVLDWAGPEGDENSIGTLLYHLAAVEMGWLYGDILEQPFPEKDFPVPGETQGRLTPVPGVALDDHLARLDRCRTVFLEKMQGMTLGDWSRLRRPEGEAYAVSPAWAVFHLVEHEAGHAAQIGVMKKRARAALLGSGEAL